MKVKKFKKFQNKMGLKVYKVSTLNTPGTETPLSHSLLESFLFEAEVCLGFGPTSRDRPIAIVGSFNCKTGQRAPTTRPTVCAGDGRGRSCLRSVVTGLG